MVAATEKPTVLVVEDEPRLLIMINHVLKDLGYKTISASSGVEALELVESGVAFDLLLTDIVMPEMDGIELARRATEVDPDLKVMFITGFAAVALNPDSNAPKDAKVLSKPFHLRDLVDEVEKMLAAA